MIGLTLSGRYELLARVGGGGMALVYKARDLLLNRFVAVKVLRQQFTHDDDFVKRFRREAQAAASLSHPNIVSIYDVGQVEDTHYIVMEFIDGANLNEIIRDRAPLQVDEAVKITAQICDALEHAHHNQIIHRDIKPHNILIGNNGRVKVTDFGIARAVTSSTITQTGSVIGSVHYFSPEHAKGVATGEKSDLYSLGIVLYQMLTGRLPFLGESPISVALKHLQEPFEQPRKVNPYIPQSVENVILRAMRKNPQERYQSAREMLSDLETCLQPQRLTEPAVQYSSDEDNEEDKTKVMPAIRPDMINTIEAPAVKVSNSNQEERWNSDGLTEPKRKWVLPTVLGVLAVVLIAVLIWAVSALKQQMPDDVMVPNMVGKKLEEAKEELIAAGFTIADPILYEVVEDKDPDIVIKQDKVNMEAKEGSPIQLTVSKAKDLPPMPDLAGKTLGEAKEILMDMGVKSGNIGTNPVFDESEPDTVLDQVPAKDELFDPTTAVINLKISKGEEAFPMPKLLDKTESEAKAILLSKNLSEGKIFREPSYSPKGKVFKQSVEENEMVTPDTEIMIWVSSGYPEDSREQKINVTVFPTVEGQTSKFRIVYSDATGDNIEGGTYKISSTTSIPITLILSPSKDGLVTIYRDGQVVQTEPVPYRVIPADTTQEPDPGTIDDGTASEGVPETDEGSIPVDGEITESE
ncbi:Stk1 family PASTA domain-containing Ser/Thr kinase [Cohnella cholangitidis]|uniref:Serine/threonine-protein kinase PrkC n=1 Tax=Cohnella cholangitidis TaxID=2598458 RepID=A0A7G5BTH1_9BACL|nr:Stk1 family PASTA domain-containing Ser/Thr kinase [Cohnella cholangitidis]QMV40255.1 Stk1 family PASTA domain-containing Ser/Thr kinase [Cohnella cholangitidis]